MGPLRPQVVTPLVWVVAGGCWVAQLTLPWTSDATLSRSTFADAITLVRGGGVSAAVSSWVIVGALVLPVAGVLLVALAGLRGRVAQAARLLVATAGTVALVVATRTVPQDDAGLGVGGKVAVAGCAAVLLAVGLEVVTGLRRLDRPHGAAPHRGAAVAGVVVGVAALVLAVAGAAHVGWQAARHEGGADSPQDAARELVAALVERDAVALLGLAAPEEVERVVDTFLSLRDKMGGDDGGTSVTDTVSLDVDDVRLEVESQGADRARVTLVGGDYTIDVDLDALPGPFRALEVLFPDGTWSGDLADLTGSPVALFLGDQGERLSVSTVRVDGRWYVTGLGTAIDQVTAVLLGDGLATPELDDLPGLLLDRLGDDEDDDD